MVYLKTDEEIELMRESNLLVGKTLGMLSHEIKAGVTTLALDQLAEAFIRDHQAEPGFKGYEGFPFTLCTSVNEEVVHGMPSEHRILQDGDIVSVDCGVLKNGFYGDSAYTFMVGEVSPEVRMLLTTTKQALYAGIEQAVAGNRLGDLAYAIQTCAEAQNYGVVREMVGHGIGRQLHEAPQVPNFGRRGQGMKLKEGLVIAIEPMINMGGREIEFDREDGWTTRTKDRMPSAHFEHTVAVKRGKVDILSSFEYIKE